MPRAINPGREGGGGGRRGHISPEMGFVGGKRRGGERAFPPFWPAAKKREEAEKERDKEKMKGHTASRKRRRWKKGRRSRRVSGPAGAGGRADFLKHF